MEICSEVSDSESLQEPHAKPEPVPGICVLRVHVVATVALLLRTTLEMLGDLGRYSRRPEKGTEYNTYIRVREQVKEGRGVAKDMAVFGRAVSSGIRSRIRYRIDVAGGKVLAESEIHLMVGDNVIKDGRIDRRGVLVSVDWRGRIKNHSMCLPRRLKRVIDGAFGEASLSSGGRTKEDPFGKRDDEELQKIPATRQEFKTHPLYTLSSTATREVVYPKARGSVGLFTYRKKGAGRREEKVFPRANVKRLVTEREAWRMGLRIETGTRPFRVLRKRALGGEEAVGLYAPWQCKEELPRQRALRRTIDIPEGLVYYVETPGVLYGPELKKELEDRGIGYTVPCVGWSIEPRSSGLLIKKEAASEFEAIAGRVLAREFVEEFNLEKRRIYGKWGLVVRKAQRYLEILSRL